MACIAYAYASLRQVLKEGVEKLSAAKLLLERYGEEQRRLSQKIKQIFDESRATLIFVDGEFSENLLGNEQETVAVHETNWKEFSVIRSGDIVEPYGNQAVGR